MFKMNTFRSVMGIVVLVSMILRASVVSSTEVVQITKSFKTFDYAYFELPKLTWVGALQYCSVRGSYLVDITSNEEQNFVLGLQKQADSLKSKNHSLPAWTGGNSLDNDVKEFRWIKTGKFVNNKVENMDIHAIPERNCLAIRQVKTKKFKLHTQRCGVTRPFVCKLKQ